MEKEDFPNHHAIQLLRHVLNLKTICIEESLKFHMQFSVQKLKCKPSTSKLLVETTSIIFTRIMTGRYLPVT